MARSQIIKDLVNGDNNIESVLLRLKIILSDLENEKINKWIDSEIQGYENPEDVPLYRILYGEPIGTFILGNPNYGLKHTNHRVPLGHLEKEMREDLLTVPLTDGVLGIKSLLESQSQVGKPIPTEFCHAISNHKLFINSMNVSVSINKLQGVIANIKTKLLNILLKIEKEYGNLDALDTLSDKTNTQTLESIEQYIINVIFEDNSVRFGNNNKIKSSEIGHRGSANVN